MPRYAARCDMQIPVTMILDDPARRQELETVTSNLSLRGAFLNSRLAHFPKDERLTLIARPANERPIVVQARILRKEKDGIAVKFLDLFPEKKELLWNFLREHIPKTATCPYCGERNVSDMEHCFCGLSLDFTDQRYLVNQEKQILRKETEALEEATVILNARLEAIETRFRREPEHENALLAELTGAIQDFFKAAETLEDLAGPHSQILRQRQVEFRKSTPLFLKSRFMRHARTWPSGYPGDFRIIEDIYRNTPLSEGLGYLLDRYYLSTELAQGVQSRLSKVREILAGELAVRKDPLVLNVACGSSREVMELTPELRSSRARVTLLDLDREALQFAVIRLSLAGIEGQLRPVRYNAMRLVNKERNENEFGRQDLIYSMGLFDYLDDDVVVRLLDSLYDLLKPSGKMLITFKDCERYRSQDYHWLVDWSYFHLRNEGDCLGLIDRIGVLPQNVQLRRDETGMIMLIVLTKD